MVAKLPGNLRETLRNAAPVIGSVVAGLANDGYAASKMLPKVDRGPMRAHAGNFLTYRADAFFGDTDLRDEVPVGSMFQRSVSGNTALIPYSVRRYGLNFLVDQMELRDLPLMDEAAQIATLEHRAAPTVEALRIAREARVAALYQTPGNYATTVGSAGWANPATDIIGEIDARMQVIRAVGRKANTFYASEPVRATLRTAPQILNFLNVNTNRNRLDDDAVIAFLKDQFGFENVIFGTAVSNTVNLAVGTLTPGYVFNRTVFVGYVPSENGEAGTIGRIVGEDTMLTPSATYALGGDDSWGATYIEDSVQPHLVGYNFAYEETMGVLQAALGTTLTAV